MSLKSVLLVSALSVAAASQAAGLIPNSLLVLQEQGTSSAATSISLLNYTTAGVLGATSTYAVSGITQSGSATSEGALNLSADGKKISFVGYGAAAGTSGVVGGTSARKVGTIDIATGAIDTSTVTGQFSGNNIRSSYVSGSTYYAVGANSGLVSGTVGSTTAATALGTQTTNLRVVKGYGGNVYFSTGSGTAGIYQYDAAATGKQTLIVGTGTSTSPYDFQFVSATSLLVADSSAGIKLYTKNGSAWSVSQTLAGSAAASFTLLGGSIYFVSADGTKLNTATFDGSTFGTVSTLATSGTGKVFRGVEAVPEPASMVALGLGAAALVRRRRSAK